MSRAQCTENKIGSGGDNIMIQNKVVGEDEPATGLDISTTNRNLPISPSRISVVTLLPNSSQVSIDSLRKPLLWATLDDSKAATVIGLARCISGPMQDFVSFPTERRWITMNDFIDNPQSLNHLIPPSHLRLPCFFHGTVDLEPWKPTSRVALPPRLVKNSTNCTEIPTRSTLPPQQTSSWILSTVCCNLEESLL